MKIASRNVNGIRAVMHKDFFPWVKMNDPDIICLQEVKAFETQIPSEIRFYLSEYDYLWHHGKRPWYAGTAIFYKKQGGADSCFEVQAKKAEFVDACFWEEGRITQLDFQYRGKEISLLNCYFPNGNPRADGTEMLPHKLAFYERFRCYGNQLRKEGRLVVATGDFNVCHTAIDIARPEENKNSIGFLPVERAELDKFVDDGYVDVFRHFYPDVKDKYTWWSYRSGAKERNVWRRLDYFWVSEDVLPLLVGIEHQEHVQGSDHCAVVLEMG